jgi:predicted aconitase
MILTDDQRAILTGKQGESLAKVMKTLVMYGEAFGAEKMVSVTAERGHLVTSFGLSVMKPVFELLQTLIDDGVTSRQPFSVDPRPLDENVPSNPLQDLLFSIMYGKQKDYEKQLAELGLMGKDAFTCACYMDQVGNVPKKGDVLSWAESSAVVYANSVLGARCNRNSGIIDIFGSMVGCVPYFGLLTDAGRKASWVIDVRTSKLPEAQILGSAIGMKVMEEVPYIKGLSIFLGAELNQAAKDYLKDMGAACASNGAVGLYHVASLTPEAKDEGEALIKKGANVYVIDDAELERVKASYPCIWKDPHAAPKLCFVGCPHLSLDQLMDWTARLKVALTVAGKKCVALPTVFTAAPGVAAEFAQKPEASWLKRAGVTVSSICPLMYMNNPLCGKMPVVTNSNKLRTYSSARYYTDAEILDIVTKGGRK